MIEPIRFRCFKVLPLVYDESLSYYEVLCKVAEKLNSVIDSINNFQQEYKSYVDASIEKTIIYINEQDDLIKNEITTLERDITNKINELYIYIDESDEKNRQYSLYLMENLYNYIDQHLLDNVNAYNPTNGFFENVSKVLSDIYGVLRYYALTANEYDSLNLSAAEYDNKNISAKDYDLCSLSILGIDRRFYMFNPVSGFYMTIKETIYSLVDAFHREDGLTSSGYDSLDLSASEYDGQDLTSFDYDFRGVTLLT